MPFDPTAAAMPSDTGLTVAEARDARWRAERSIQSMIDHMLASRGHNYAYAYTPKCACTTMKTLLWKAEAAMGSCPPLDDYGNIHLAQLSGSAPWEVRQTRIAERLSQDENEFRFTFVRNPFARAYSAYAWLLLVANDEGRAQYSAKLGWNGANPPSFETFLEIISVQDPGSMDTHWAPLTSFLPFDSFGFDFIGAVETLQEDAPIILKRIFGDDAHFDPELRMYASNVAPEFSERAIELIKEIYAQDFELFGYATDPTVAAPDKSKLAALTRSRGPSIALREAISDWFSRESGPGPGVHRLLRSWKHDIALENAQSLALRNHEMPEWWSANRCQIWTRHGAPLPNIVAHPGLPPPRHALIVLVGDAPQTTIYLWGDASTIFVGYASSLPASEVICEGGSSIYVGSSVTSAGGAKLDARNGAMIDIGDDGLWFYNVKIRTDGLHAIRDASTGARLNAHGQSVSIGMHVWLGDDVMIEPGAVVGSGGVYDARAVVRGTMPSTAWCSGAPARVQRLGVAWSRDNLP